MKFYWAILLTLLAACTADDVDVETPLPVQVEPVIESAGVIWADYALGMSSASVHAQFVRVRGISVEQAMAALDVWMPDTELALDACAVRRAPKFETGVDVQVELLNAGPLTIESAFGRAFIEGRHLPDLGQISGVVYGNDAGYGRDLIVVPYEAGLPYRWALPGGEIGGVEAQMEAPEVPVVLSGTVFDTAKLSQLNDPEFVLEWQPPTVGAAGLFLSIATGDGGAIECRLEDDGTFTLPGALLEPLRQNGQGAELVLRRVSVQALEIAGVDHTQLVFGARDSLFLFW